MVNTKTFCGRGKKSFASKNVDFKAVVNTKTFCGRGKKSFAPKNVDFKAVVNTKTLSSNTSRQTNIFIYHPTFFAIFMFIFLENYR